MLMHFANLLARVVDDPNAKLLDIPLEETEIETSLPGQGSASTGDTEGFDFSF